MKLAIFDVDGTLLDNVASEDTCFTQALSEVMFLPTLDDDWASYRHVSDAGIATEAYQRVFGGAPTLDLLDATIVRFVELLTHAHETEHISQVPGAARLLTALPQRGWAVAIATGAWHRAAAFKLLAASLPWDNVPIATAEDGPARTDIVQRARSRAQALHHGTPFERVVSIGDGVWDIQAARELGLPFVGVGFGARACRLRAAGASITIADFADLASTVSALEQAREPLSPVP